MGSAAETFVTHVNFLKMTRSLHYLFFTHEQSLASGEGWIARQTPNKG